MERNRRIQTRESIEIPILYTQKYGNVYHEALTCDISAGGLSFKADQKFSNGDRFLIKPVGGIPVLEPISQHDPWTAQVQWCVKNQMDDGYKVGIRRIESIDHPQKKQQVAPELQCELCGILTLEDAVDIQCGVTLCSDCFAQCYKSAGKTLQETIGRFITGNVI